MKTYQKIYLLLKEKEDYISGEDMAQELGISRTSIWKAIRQLETFGLTIEAARNRGYKLAEGDLLLPELIAQELNLPVHLNGSSDSTQLDAKQGIELGHSSPALYLAPHQNKAKGRFGRPFYASKSGGIQTIHYISCGCCGKSHPVPLRLGCSNQMGQRHLSWTQKSGWNLNRSNFFDGKSNSN